MSIIENRAIPKKNKRSETHHGSPRKPLMVMSIIEGRDSYQKTWEDLGKEFKISRAGARHLYHKWYDWYREKIPAEG
jgi:hypothetical protein